ncbi:MAG: helix-turn-helix transcriptional regulator [Bacteriovoracaceae bacterium]|nr:helix-turn-helix transcriptional regulator [Bacteriovoracaceae bacterium]
MEDSTPDIKLVKELKMLRKRVLVLEKENNRNSRLWKEQEELKISLRERIKELNCLYKISEFIELYGDSLDKIFREVVSLLPVSWQYPEIACARIIFKKDEYKTLNFRQSRWVQESLISVGGQSAGKVEVFYSKKMPSLYEGPFLEDERKLINAVSERLGKVVERIYTSEQLAIEKLSLQNTNIALHDVLDKIQGEKKMIGVSIQANIDKVIFPILYALEKDLNPQQNKYLDLIKSNLKNIIGPFVDKEHGMILKLSPAEIQVCNMIKNGFSTKDIAIMKKISPDTVSRHRESIRRKLGIANKKINLVSYLNNVN